MKTTGAPAWRALRVTALMRAMVPPQSKAAPSPSHRPCWTSMTRTAVVMVSVPLWPGGGLAGSVPGDDDGRALRDDHRVFVLRRQVAARADQGPPVGCLGHDAALGGQE